MNDVMINKLKVLVIDDEPEKKALLRRILERQGFAVIWRRNWKEVKQLFSQIMEKGLPMPDIVLVDMNFYSPHNVLGENPAMEGVLIIQKFSEICEMSGIEIPPIIGFTGREDYMQRQEMIRAGVIDFITAEEFRDSAVLGRRLLQCIQEAREMRMLKPPANADIQKIEESIVQRALQLNNNDANGAAELLDWDVAEVMIVKNRLEEKANGL